VLVGWVQAGRLPVAARCVDWLVHACCNFKARACCVLCTVYCACTSSLYYAPASLSKMSVISVIIARNAAGEQHSALEFSEVFCELANRVNYQ
jgi:hypothetical protein